MPLPREDFDPTEAGVTFTTLVRTGHRVVVATPDGKPARADHRMVEGTGLGPWKGLLRADAHGRAAHDEMAHHPAFQSPVPYEQAAAEPYGALVLPGGHAPGMRYYLESPLLQSIVARFFDENRPVGAICHGVVLAARSRSAKTGQSVLHGRRTTALTHWMEMSAWLLTAAWLGSYYRTYPQTVQWEVTAALAQPEDFLTGPFSSTRDTPTRLGAGFTVRDGNYLSARWPGDAHRFASEFAALLS